MSYKRKRLFVYCVILSFGVLILAAPEAAIAPVHADPAGQDDVFESCAVSLFSIEEQKQYAFARLAGGTAQLPDPILDVPILGVAPDVTIVVIDDFSVYPGSSGSHGEAMEEIIQRTSDFNGTVVAVDIAETNFTATEIAATLAAALDRIPENQSLVINMSFAFVPCIDAATGFDFFQFQELQLVGEFEGYSLSRSHFPKKAWANTQVSPLQWRGHAVFSV